MFSTKYFRDEKFKDTIKKNSCRLRQKSSVQIGGFLLNQSKEPKEQPHPKYQIQEDNKDFFTRNRTIERNKTPNNKLLNFIRSKNFQNNCIKESVIEDKQIIVKKKVSEECTSSIKNRILSKLKEQRNDKINNIDKYENNIENQTIRNEAKPKDIIVNRKKFSAGIKNIIYRNKIYNKNLSNTIKKEENTENINNIVNSMNLVKNNNNEKKGIYSLKNINSKRYNNYLDGKYSSNSFMEQTFKNEKINLFNRIRNNNNGKNNKDNNKDKEKNNKENSIEIKNDDNKENDRNSIFIKRKSKNRRKNFSNYEFYNKDLENFNFNQTHNDNIDENKNKKERKNSKENKYNKENKNNKDILGKNNDTLINKENKEINGNDNNDLIFVHKKENYFGRKNKYKYIKKNEEEKSKNCNDDLQNENIINKTNSKPIRKNNYFSEIISKRFSATNARKRFKDIQTSLKLSVNKSPADFDYDYNLTSAGEREENKKYNASTEKRNHFSKSSYFKSLFINTGENDDFNKENTPEVDKNKNSIFRNHLRYNIKEKRDINLSNSNLSNKERGGISELLKSEKKPNLDRTIRINGAKNYTLFSYDYPIKMINEAIQLKNSIEIQSLFSILIINFNNKFLFTFDSKEFPKDIPKFSEVYKYYCIMTIPLIFLHKDEILYKNSSSEAKIVYEKFIYLTIKEIGQKNMPFKKIDSFIDEFIKENKNNNNETISMEECCLQLIKLIFKNYKAYSPLKKAIEQLLSFAKNESLEKMINIINDTILYCFNHKQKNSFFLLDKKITGNKNKNYFRLNQISNKELNKSISTPTTPFIRCAMKKNFCLVLDIDETIVHSMNLPFGNYFLLRPGVINFLEELSKLYEIIIFTSSPKYYADGILNKIDIDNNYISHRLYKDHVIFEKGKSVKKLNMIGRDLKKIIFVDNMKSNAKYNPANLCHVSTWFFDINDEEIIKLKLKLKYIATNNKFKDDIRKGLGYSL